MHPQISSVLNWANPYSPKPNDIVANNAEKVLNYIEDINTGTRGSVPADPGRQPFYRLENWRLGVPDGMRKKWIYNFFIHQKRIRESEWVRTF